MSARHPRWELCQSKASGYWVRFRSSNGNIIVQSETYKRKRDALHAAELAGNGWLCWHNPGGVHITVEERATYIYVYDLTKVTR